MACSASSPRVAAFSRLRTRVRSDGLLRGEVELWPDEAEQPVPVEFALLQTHPGTFDRNDGAALAACATQSSYDDASWLGLRLAELLPLADEEQQHCWK